MALLSLSHSMSVLLGRFHAIHIRKISTTPSENGKLRKSCAYFAHCDQPVKPFGPSKGCSSFLPSVRLSPVMPKMTKQVADIQCTKRSKALNRTMVRPE